MTLDKPIVLITEGVSDDSHTPIGGDCILNVSMVLVPDHVVGIDTSEVTGTYSFEKTSTFFQPLAKVRKKT